MTIFEPQIAYAQVNSLDLINGVNNNFVNTVNSSWDFWIWIIGIGLFIWLVSLIGGAFIQFFKTIFQLKKGRKY